MRVAVCDDEQDDLNQIIAAVSAYGMLKIFGFANSKDLLDAVERTSFDLVILDIEMPGMNGYDAAVKLRSMARQPLIIFLTNSVAYTLRGYGVSFRYLTKPINREQIYSALDSAIREIQANRFMFQVDGTSRVVPMDEIYYLEVFNHHTILHTMDQSFTFRATLKEILAQLPSGYFGVPHQSYVVSFYHIQTATGTEIQLTNGAVIPMSRRKKLEFERQFHQYLGR